MDCENQMDSEHQIEMCVKETDKVEPPGLGFGISKPDRSPVPQGLCLSSNSLRKNPFNNSTGFGEPVFGNTVSKFRGLGTQSSNLWKPFSTIMVSYQRRMQTFQRWPKQIAQWPEFLAQSGFYYSGCRDSVTCFYCRLTLKEWDWTDSINFEHKKFSPECKYLSMVCDM